MDAKVVKKHIPQPQVDMVMKDLKWTMEKEHIGVTKAADIMVQKYAHLSLSASTIIRWSRTDGARKKSGRKEYMPADSTEAQLFRAAVWDSQQHHCGNTMSSMRSTVCEMALIFLFIWKYLSLTNTQKKVLLGWCHPSPEVCWGQGSSSVVLL